VAKPSRSGKELATIVLATAATAATMLLLDLTWLGVVARGFYAGSLAPLARSAVFLPAAGLFYATYIAAVVVHAVLGAANPTSAARRGAALGLVAYATYDLTNWATLRDWPALLVPVDIAWGIVLTAAAACVGKLVQQAARHRLQ
jgi:uncharacterized membrane protein